ncbi:PREDICTED: F-box/kelch-repeat protein At3g23880-like isoform X2 [Nelumbo nucifera]|uniref:F-box/kelch-repeat protein At3g23880-like isoform X2 n=1 Tax=Nelumbo nucifera TaxID=4432 RepID=A0A1U8AZD0_NELNU|nr:PREDICTED: F-box/kelch-repeat protein At3g23880-like isoform X2 [Nelumbo nucifera]XP_010268494.1 PREDICTED: F-box/kelch-repeat protein At3g23880-like isoform X2 [Nelumbo nucifera]XP_019054665.1 PREDICTED: F-box/kelch-repeat protein At3g23880-like isoform X2 [Nelumbo nucifera]
MEENTKRAKQEKCCAALSPNFIPDEIIDDILSRLPVESLMRFKSVCKSWCDKIGDPHFIRMHLNRATREASNYSHFFVKTSTTLHFVDLESFRKAKLVLPFEKTSIKKVQLVDTCNGLVCLSLGSRLTYLWNPATRDCRQLPIEFHRSGYYTPYLGFGYEPTSDEYKVVRLIYGSNYRKHELIESNLYTLGTNSWKKLEIGSHPYASGFYGHGSWLQLSHALGKRSIHWIIYGSDWTKIAAFDLKDEMFREVSCLPRGMDDEIDWGHGLHALEGCLAVACNRRSGTDIWVMQDYGSENSWTKMFSLTRSDFGDYKYFCNLELWKNSHLVVHSEKSLLLIDIINKRKIGELRINRPHSRTTYTETLVSPRVAGRINEGIEVEPMGTHNGVREVFSEDQSVQELELQLREMQSDMRWLRAMLQQLNQQMGLPDSFPPPPQVRVKSCNAISFVVRVEAYVTERVELGTQVELMGTHNAVREVLGKEHPSQVMCLGFEPYPRHAFGTPRSGNSTATITAMSHSQLQQRFQGIKLQLQELRSDMVWMRAMLQQLGQQMGLPDLFPPPPPVQSHELVVTPVLGADDPYPTPEVSLLDSLSGTASSQTPARGNEKGKGKNN